MKIIDADKLKSTIEDNEYTLRDNLNSLDKGMFTVGIFQAIDEQEELPTMQSNHICAYCSRYGKQNCEGVERYKCFEGKRMIEVEV